MQRRVRPRNAEKAERSAAVRNDGCSLARDQLLDFLRPVQHKAHRSGSRGSWIRAALRYTDRSQALGVLIETRFVQPSRDLRRNCRLSLSGTFISVLVSLGAQPSFGALDANRRKRTREAVRENPDVAAAEIFSCFELHQR